MKPGFTTLRLLVVLILLAVTITAQAQDRWGIHFRPGVSFATTDLGDADLKTGAGFELNVSYRFMPHTAVYTGWGWNRFSSDQSFAGADRDFEETGYTLGLQFIHPFTENLPFDYFVRAGAIYNHIEVENAEEDIIADSGHGLGFQVETGLSFSMADSWKIIPGIKYQTVSRDLRIMEMDYAVDLNYLSVGITLLKSL